MRFLSFSFGKNYQDADFESLKTALNQVTADKTVILEKDAFTSSFVFKAVSLAEGSSHDAPALRQAAKLIAGIKNEKALAELPKNGLKILEDRIEVKNREGWRTWLGKRINHLVSVLLQQKGQDRVWLGGESFPYTSLAKRWVSETPYYQKITRDLSQKPFEDKVLNNSELRSIIINLTAKYGFLEETESISYWDLRKLNNAYIEALFSK